jgi:hypothetical protein
MTRDFSMVIITRRRKSVCLATLLRRSGGWSPLGIEECLNLQCHYLEPQQVCEVSVPLEFVAVCCPVLSRVNWAH